MLQHRNKVSDDEKSGIFCSNNTTVVLSDSGNKCEKLKKGEIMIESILITGANIGLGKEASRQLALKKETKRIILFCRNQAKAEAAKKDLEEKTGKKIFEIVIGDISDANSVRKAVEKIKEPIDAIILNAGGIVGKTAGKITASGMNELAATNILGHVILVEELIKHNTLKKTVLLASTEAVRGVKQMGMKPVSMKTSSVDEFAAVLDGSFFGDNFDMMQAYGYVKYAATMWMFSMARKYPDLKFVAMSPGNTGGTNAPDNLPPAMKFMMRYIMMPIVMPLIGVVHKLEVGAQRLVDGVSDDRYKSGVFYASKEGKLTGDVVDQSTFYTDLKNTTFQDNADKAIHRFIK
jgi:NAD(P)-dependent dehydrogenase (short-subunit alcohol dehydrogenase family)